MNVLVLLAAILFILMIVIGGKKGARSFISLFLNFGVLFVAVVLMADPNFSPIIVTLIASIIIASITLFFINEVNSKTIAAFVSTIVAIAILLIFIVLVTKRTMIQGFGKDRKSTRLNSSHVK